jgi:hypothetical protein
MFQYVESLIKKNCIITKPSKDIYNEDWIDRN